MSSSKKSSGDKAARDNRANQLNPNHSAYWSGRGETPPKAPPPANPPKTTKEKQRKS